LTERQLGSWHSADYVAEWVGADVLDDLLLLPRQISTALVANEGIPVEHVVDLGAGPGAYLTVLMKAFPSAHGTWVDSSQPMRARAQERLAALGARVDYVIGDVEALAEIDLDPPDVVVTSRVLHHFSPETLQSLYGAVFELLRRGGFFFNLDHFGAPPRWEARYRAIRREFTAPPTRETRPHRHDFPLQQVERHLDWLAAAGFEAPDTPWRTFYSALLAARKP
jgi:SAM-dependent methyltransferase